MAEAGEAAPAVAISAPAPPLRIHPPRPALSPCGAHGPGVRAPRAV